MFPDWEDVVDMLIEYERVVDDRGWDQDLVLSEVLSINEKDGAYLVVRSTPVQPNQVGEDPIEGMQIIVRGWESRSARELVARMDPLYWDSYVGLVFMYEADAYDVVPDRPGGPIDFGGEHRSVAVVDCRGRLYTTYRERGWSRPKVWVRFADGNAKQIAWPGQDEGEWASMMFVTAGITVSLVELLLAKTAKAPADSCDRPALRALLEQVRGAEA